ncbi:MAG: monovalent cation/H+ antiporter complex subunit F [bacterium]
MLDLIQGFFVDSFFVFIILALFLIINRLRLGPTLADRVVALDLFSTLILSAIVVASLYLSDSLYSDAALILGIVSFMGTVVFARFIEDQEND